MTLPRHTPTTLREMIRFDVTIGLPTAASVLRQRLSLAAAARVIARVVLGSLRDPLAGLERGDWPEDKERLVRYQLRTAVLLDDALARERGLSEDERLDVLHAVVTGVGARFIPFAMQTADAASWRAATDEERLAYVAEATPRFFNCATRNHRVGETTLAFDVSVCRFVPLAHQLGRPYLAKMFCEADTVYFSRPEAPVRMRRSQTIANGADYCDFRFEYEPPRGS